MSNVSEISEVYALRHMYIKRISFMEYSSVWTSQNLWLKLYRFFVFGKKMNSIFLTIWFFDSFPLARNNFCKNSFCCLFSDSKWNRSLRSCSLWHVLLLCQQDGVVCWTRTETISQVIWICISASMFNWNVLEFVCFLNAMIRTIDNFISKF